MIERIKRIKNRTVTLKDAVVLQIAGAVLVFGVFGLSGIGDRELLAEIQQSGGVSAAGQQGIRCILKLKPNPERKHRQTQKLIDKCYKDFDALRKVAKANEDLYVLVQED